MSTITFKINLKPIEKELRNLGGVNREKFQRAVLTDAQEIFLNYIKQLAPKKTGQYAKSWIKGKLIGKTAEVTSPEGKLFNLLEFTGAKPQLRIRNASQGPYVFQTESGETIFTFKINWPGFDNIPHVRPALRRLEKDMSTIIAANMSKLSILYNDISNQNKPKVKQLKKVKVSKTNQSRSGTRKLNKSGSVPN